MSTCTITGSTVDVGLAPQSGVTLSFTPHPQRVQGDGSALVMPGVTSTGGHIATSDENGDFSIDLVPGRYRVQVMWQEGGFGQTFYATVPDSASSTLAGSMDLPPPPSVNAAEQAVIDARLARDTANAAKTAALDAETGAQAAETGAVAARDAASGHRSDAQSAQTAAEAAETAATTQAGIATTKAGEAATSANAAAASEQGVADDAAAATQSATLADQRANAAESARDASQSAQTSSEAARDKAQDWAEAVNVKKATLDTSVADSTAARDASQAWAESATAPGGAGTKSAKTWAGVAESFSVGAFFLTDETPDLLYLTTNTDTVSVVSQTDDTLTLEIA